MFIWKKYNLNHAYDKKGKVMEEKSKEYKDHIVEDMNARVKDLISEQEIAQEQQFKQIKQRMVGEILSSEQTNYNKAENAIIVINNIK